MPGTREGRIKQAAKTLGITIEEYTDHIERSERRCWSCKEWKALSAFGKDRTRADGIAAQCLRCRHAPNPYAKSKGRSVWMKGKTHTSEARTKMSASRKGNKNRLGKPFTPEQIALIRKRVTETTPRGPKNPRWKGGITPGNKRIRETPEYANWRTAVFTRDNYTCQECGDSRGGNLNAHHVLAFAIHPGHRFDINNGLTLCENCHIKAHSKKDGTK